MEIWNFFFIEIRNLDSHKRSVSCIFLGQYQIQAPPRAAPLFSLVSLCSMWDLSSLTRDWNWALRIGRTVVTTEPPEKSQGLPSKDTSVLFFSLRWGHPSWCSGKESTCQGRRCKRHRFDPWVGNITWRRRWHSIQYSCLENFLGRGAWWPTVHEAAKSWTWLSGLAHTYIWAVIPACDHL